MQARCKEARSCWGIAIKPEGLNLCQPLAEEIQRLMLL
jgi:hypothetical protein